jgi:type VI protein secretion system component Hcp
MNRFVCMVIAVRLFLATGIAEGAVEMRFSVAGLASNMPAKIFDWSMHDFDPSGSASGKQAKTTDVLVTRVTDSFSPSIMNAVTSGTPYSSATLTYCKPNCSSPTSSGSFLLQDVLLNSYNLGSGGGLPEESIGVRYSKMTATYLPIPTPPRTA